MGTKVNRLVIKPYSNKELAPIFNRSERAFRREIARLRPKLGERIGHRWSILQVEIIFFELGRPYEIMEDSYAVETSARDR
jgi:hypothetical protein